MARYADEREVHLAEGIIPLLDDSVTANKTATSMARYGDEKEQHLADGIEHLLLDNGVTRTVNKATTSVEIYLIVVLVLLVLMLIVLIFFAVAVVCAIKKLYGKKAKTGRDLEESGRISDDSVEGNRSVNEKKWAKNSDDSDESNRSGNEKKKGANKNSADSNQNQEDDDAGAKRKSTNQDAGVNRRSINQDAGVNRKSTNRKREESAETSPLLDDGARVNRKSIN